jgi:rhodanese-related sulfurtransferase
MSKSKPASRKPAARKPAPTPKTKSPNPLIIGLGVLLLVALVATAALLLNRPAPAAAVNQSVPGALASLPDEVSVAKAAELRDQGAFILDVRTPEEWADYHIPGSTLIPIDELESRVNEVPRDQQVVVVCRSGNRSAVGRDILKNADFDQVTSMAGGLNVWRADGLDTVSGP